MVLKIVPVSKKIHQLRNINKKLLSKLNYIEFIGIHHLVLEIL